MYVPLKSSGAIHAKGKGVQCPCGPKACPAIPATFQELLFMLYLDWRIALSFARPEAGACLVFSPSSSSPGASRIRLVYFEALGPSTNHYGDLAFLL